MMPTAHEAALAIVLGARATGAYPIDVASGARPRDHFDRKAISNARTYAAIALLKFFNCSQSAIDRMVGAASIGSFVAGMKVHLDNKKLGWYDVAVEKIILDAIADQHVPEVRTASSQELDEWEEAQRPTSVASTLAGTPIKDIRGSLLFEAVRNTVPRVEE